MINQELADYIRQAAIARGIDPNIALRVAQGEGGLNDPFRHGEGPAPSSQAAGFGSRENSYGPFQLYISGNGAGLGDRALAAGIDPRTNWKGGVDFALNEVVNKGWDQWYGAKAAGITGMRGVGPDAALGAINTAIGAPSAQGNSRALGYANNQPAPPGLVMQVAARGDKLPVQNYQQQADQADDQILNNWLKASTGAQTPASGNTAQPYTSGTMRPPVAGAVVTPQMPAATTQTGSTPNSATSPAQQPNAAPAPPVPAAAPAASVPASQQAAPVASDDDLLKQWVGAPSQDASATPQNAPGGFVTPKAPPGVVIHGDTADTISDRPDLAAQRTGNPDIDAKQDQQLLAQSRLSSGLVPFFNGLTFGTAGPAMGAIEGAAHALTGGSYGEGYQFGKKAMDTALTHEEATNPKTAFASQLAGGALGMVGAAAAAPTAMGVDAAAPLAQNVLLGGASNAAIGGTSALLNSGGNLNQGKYGAEIGALSGVAGPVLGKALGAVGNRLLNLGSGTNAAARNVAGILEQAGMTPQEAQNALLKMGPEATLADVNPALTTEAGGLAALGGKPTSILKTAMGARAAAADDRVAQAVEQTLGPRPDITQIEEGIKQQATAAADPHYTNMRANGAPLDAGTVLDAIDQKLATANGSEKNILTKFRSYLYDPNSTDMAQQVQQAAGTNLNNITDYIARTGSNDPGLDQARQILVSAQAGRMSQADAIQALSKVTTSDPAANPLLNQAATDLNNISPLKSDPQALLKVRQAMDDDISKMPMSDTTGGKNAERTANGIRGEIDAVLKRNPDIQAGDAAYSQTISQRDALQEGQDLFKPATRIEDVQRSIAGKTTAQVNAMRQGALGTVWDTIDNARQGDLQAVKSLLGKSTANRAKLDALFPQAGDLFDKIQSEAAMRATEQRVGANSATAERQAVAQKYAPQSGGGFDYGPALVGDAIAGGPGAIAMQGLKYGYGALKNGLTQASRNALIEGTARGLSATGPDQQAFINMLIRASQTAGANRALNAGTLYGSNALLGGAGQQARQQLLPSQ